MRSACWGCDVEPVARAVEQLTQLGFSRYVVRIGDDPARFVAVPAERLVARLSDQLRNRIAETESSLAELGDAGPERHAHVLPALADWEAIARWTSDAIGARRYVYLPGHAEHLAGSRTTSPARRPSARGSTSSASAEATW